MTTARIIAVGALAGSLLLAAQGNAVPAVELEATPGLAGAYRVGGWVTVAVTVRNGDAATSGLVTVAGGGSRVSRALELPASSRTTFRLQLPARTAAGSVRVSFDGGAGSAVLDVAVQSIAPTSPLIVVIAAGAAPHRPPVEPPAGHLVRTTVDQAPQSWQGLAAADTVIIEAPAASALQPAHWQALNRWLLLGGHLIILGGDSAPRELRAGAGAGLVSPVAEATTLEALARQRASDPWSTAVALSGIGTARRRPSLRDANTSLLRSAATGNGGEPGAGVLGWMALLYVLAVVGVTWRAPRRRPAARGAPVALVVVAAAFCVWGTTLGTLDGSAGVMEETVTLAHVFGAHAEAFVGQAYQAVSPGRAAYAFSFSGATSTTFSDGDIPVAVIAQAADTARIEADMRLWDRRGFHSEGFAPSPFVVERAETGIIRIRNNSAATLSACHDAATRAGGVEVPAGASIELAMRAPEPEGAHPSRARQAVIRRARLLWGEVPGKTILCVTDASFALLSNARFAHRYVGPTIVVFHVPAPGESLESTPGSP